MKAVQDIAVVQGILVELAVGQGRATVPGGKATVQAGPGEATVQAVDPGKARKEMHRPPTVGPDTANLQRRRAGLVVGVEAGDHSPEVKMRGKGAAAAAACRRVQEMQMGSTDIEMSRRMENSFDILGRVQTWWMVCSRTK